MRLAKRYRPVIVSKDNVEMQQCVSGDWTSLSEYYLLHDRLNEAKDKNAALAAENERLRKAGDAMMEVLESEIPFTAMNAVNGWLAAKEGGAK